MRSSSGISALLMAASWILVITIEPNKEAASSPIFPLAKLSSNILLLSIISRIFMVDLLWPTILRISEIDKNCPTLF
ncbi:MAG: hypothetical protein ACD_68C00094G0002 [uncultured bacterium]|nr:MAG: hypothetical protein ACD_68C00094G0002 [uncultured bacterium]